MLNFELQRRGRGHEFAINHRICKSIAIVPDLILARYPGVRE